MIITSDFRGICKKLKQATTDQPPLCTTKYRDYTTVAAHILKII